MLKQKYLNALTYGNQELIYMSTRSLIPATSSTSFTIHRMRYIDELKLYRYYKNKGAGSILCSLVPIVLANRDVEVAFEESQAFLKWIKKSLSVKERFALYLLSLYIQKRDIEKEDIYNYSLVGNFEKQELIENERLKIELLTNYQNRISLILTYLGEKYPEMASALLIHLFDPVSFDKENKMANYFEKLVQGEVLSPLYQSNFCIEDLLHLQKGESNTSSLLGNAKVLFRTEEELVVDTKRGKIELLLHL